LTATGNVCNAFGRVKSVKANVGDSEVLEEFFDGYL